ncbi:unnamed protein product [Brugia pahangi]|uniref:Uncharacterized protein n=1 Tax=Brugia pahangi TaxID=6280 RepID=A0A0N4TCL9_BRUPA|nr:unnamed protein product [Brugia pahangi]
MHCSTTITSSSFNDHLFHIHKKTMGLPALLGIVRQQACDSNNDFYNLRYLLDYYSVTTISNFTYYKYKNMVDAIMESYKTLTRRQKIIMETFIIFGYDQWIPLELVSLCIPFDISGNQNILYTALQELEPLVKSSLLGKRIADLDGKVDNDMPFMYDFHINRIMYSFLCVTVNHQAIEVEYLFFFYKLSSFFW